MHESCHTLFIRINLFYGPCGHFFYGWLEPTIPGTYAVRVCSKVAFDQLVWCPVFMIVFFTYFGLVNGDSFNTITDIIKNDLFSACLGSWKVWPLAILLCSSSFRTNGVFHISMLFRLRSTFFFHFLETRSHGWSGDEY